MNRPSPEELEAMNAHAERMHKAFAFVDPAAMATRALGREDHGITWRDAIIAIVLASELEAAGLTIAEVAEAVEFMTATKATLSEESIGVVWGVDHLGVMGWLVMADGYRAGPAGDH